MSNNQPQAAQPQNNQSKDLPAKPVIVEAPKAANAAKKPDMDKSGSCSSDKSANAPKSGNA